MGGTRLHGCHSWRQLSPQLKLHLQSVFKCMCGECACMCVCVYVCVYGVVIGVLHDLVDVNNINTGKV